jgi:hypothetical protein
MEPPTAAEKVASKGDTKTKETKEKKARSPAQIAAQQKALATLKEKRDKLKVEEEKAEKEAEVDAGKKAELDKIKYEKAKQQRKRLPVPPSYITTNDLDKFKNDLLGSLSGNKQEVASKEVKVEQPKAVEQPRIVEQPRVVEQPKVVEKPIPAPPQQKLTGHELLDRIFFNK